MFVQPAAQRSHRGPLGVIAAGHDGERTLGNAIVGQFPPRDAFQGGDDAESHQPRRAVFNQHTITFTLKAPDGGTTTFAPVTVSGNGTYSAPSYTPTQVGT